MDTLQKVTELLENNFMRILIDDPIDDALLNFTYDSSHSMTHQQFNLVIASFIIHMYKAVDLPRKQILSFEQAFEEAVWLLERGYKTDNAQGYDGAVNDAIDPERGIDSVLATMKETIKIIEQEKYISWVFESHIDPLDWDFHVKLTEEILSQFNAELSPVTIDFSPRLYAHHYIDFIKTYVSYKKDVHTSLVR